MRQKNREGVPLSPITARKNAADSIAVGERDGVRKRAGFVLVPLTGRIKVKIEIVRALEVAGDNSQAPLSFITAGLFCFSVPEFNPLNPELNPICYLLALLGAHHFLHVSSIRVKLLTFRRLMPYIYAASILDVSRSHTTTQHSR